MNTSHIVPGKTMRPSRAMFVAHIGLLVIAALYWATFANVDAPFVYHPDEPDVVARAVRMVLTGNLNPHWFHYPTLAMYLHAAVFRVLQSLYDLPIGLGLSMGVRGVEPGAFFIYYVARLVTVCFSVGTLYLILRIASRVSSPLVALFAGLTFVGSPIVSASAASVTVDMPVTFFVTAALTLLIRFVDSSHDGRIDERFLWCAVILGGLAAATKYNGAAILLAVPLAIWLAEMSLRWSLWRLPLAALLSVAVFIAITPYSILDAKTFLDPRIGMLYDFVHYASGHPGFDEGLSLLKVVRDLANLNHVLIGFVLLAPLAVRDKTVRKPIALMSFTCFLFLAMASAAKVYFPRNVLPSIPMLYCLAAAGLWAAFGKSIRNETPNRIRLWTLVLLIAVFGVTSLASVHAAYARYRDAKLIDTRTVAHDWIVQSIPEGSRILYEAYCPQLFFSRTFQAEYAWSINRLPLQRIVKDYDYVVVSEVQWKRYESGEGNPYEALAKGFPFREWKRERGKSRGPDIRIYHVRTGSYETRAD